MSDMLLLAEGVYTRGPGFRQSSGGQAQLLYQSGIAFSSKPGTGSSSHSSFYSPRQRDLSGNINRTRKNMDVRFIILLFVFSKWVVRGEVKAGNDKREWRKLTDGITAR